MYQVMFFTDLEIEASHGKQKQAQNRLIIIKLNISIIHI